MEHLPSKPRGSYSPEEKKQIIEQWKQSGLSRPAYCRQNNLSYHSLIHWTRDKRVRKKDTTSEFIPLNMPTGSENIRLVGGQIFAQIETGGKRIQLYHAVTANFLKQLLG